MVGRLLFGAQYIFRKMGRAMLRPIYQQQFDPLRGGRVGASLRLALEWWAQVLSCEVHEKIPLQLRPKPQVELFCDARSTPPRVAAVMYKDHHVAYTAWDVPDSVTRTFNQRRDAQIMGLELLAVLIGIATFMPQLRHCAVQIWEDNQGGECALTKACARASDHNLLVHATWLLAARGGIALWIERVASEDNVSDEPSRGEMTAMAALDATWHAPVLPRQIWHPDRWMEIGVHFD